MAIRMERARAEDVEVLFPLMRELQETDAWEEVFEEERVRLDLRALLENSDFGLAFIAREGEQPEKRRQVAAVRKDRGGETFAK